MAIYAERIGAVRRRGIHEISHNARVKTYPDGSQELLVCEAPIFRRSGWEEEPRASRPGRVRREADPEHRDVERAMRRARAQVKDLALCTPFRYFVTLTLDGGRVDRYDMGAITRKLNSWLDNQVRRKGLAYVLVPERHRDGAIHFHGFFNDALPVTDSGTVSLPGGGKPRRPRSEAQRAAWLAQGGRVVYNLPGWTLGFTTAIGLYGEYARAVGYVCKYFGKGGEKIGGRWYYSGGALGRPRVDYADVPVTEAQALPGAYTFAVREARMGFVLARLEGGENHGYQGVGGIFGPCDGVQVRLVLPEYGAGGLPGVPLPAGGRERQRGEGRDGE